MLQLNYIRENRDHVVERLGIKNFNEVELVDQIIALDEQRRKTQNQSDSIAAEANSSAKQIGELMRQGKKEEAEAIKSRSASYKEQIKELTEALDKIEKELHDKLIQLPNLPNKLVPKGIAAEDNEVC
ncbi:Serine--tRNA ligase [Sphingobacterium daejeonense]|nr:Serine--tRNA ligase [Sphingobacterium daejeonense]